MEHLSNICGYWADLRGALLVECVAAPPRHRATDSLLYNGKNKHFATTGYQEPLKQQHLPTLLHDLGHESFLARTVATTRAGVTKSIPPS